MPAMPPLTSPIAERGLRRERIVQSLLAEIIQGRLASGQRLVTEDLSIRFGVSHTPIREALIALAGMGIIELAPNRGAMVRRVTVRDVREACQVRRVLECEAARKACRRIPAAELDALAADFQTLKRASAEGGPDVVAQAQALDSRLHDLIADSSGNAFLAHEIHRLKFLFRAFRDAAWEHDGRSNDFGRLAEEADEHLAIVTALSARDPRAASHAMSHHIRSGLTYWCRALPTRPAARGDTHRFNGKG
jgi:DNA-binding GntR family transcriptional regulator